MKSINYKQLILPKNTQESNGTAYISVDGEYQEQDGYGYYKMEWMTIAETEQTSSSGELQ